MDDGGWRPARLTPEQMEERRLAAAALLRQGRLLRALGFPVQRPATRARERDGRAIAAWPRRDWAAIKKAGPPRGAHHHPSSSMKPGTASGPARARPGRG